MTYEVELKFPLATADDVAVLRRMITELQATPSSPLDQRDVYLAHPCRDFAQTDEVFRLRCVGDENYLTYKGPVLDASAKTRREIEIATAAGLAVRQQLLEMVTALGFQEVRDVVKRREPFHLRRHGRDIEIVLDNVHGLGWFVELETIATDADRDASREALLTLSRELHLGQSERRSYLRLLLENETPTN